MKIRIDNPTAPVREIRDILEEEYGISLSHNRVNELLREMSDKDIFQEVMRPNEEILDFYLFRIAFHYPNFEQGWEDCHNELTEDPHVMMFFNADDYYDWQLIMQFNSDREAEQWIHSFFTKHGELIAQFDNTKLPTVHKFNSDAGVFDHMLWQSKEGKEYLEHADENPNEKGIITTEVDDDGFGIGAANGRTDRDGKRPDR
ncbi:MAG: helix-turn-helix domain-containing protein [Natronomonas sp.]